MNTTFKCPQCGGEMDDFREADDWGWFADAPFRCNGFYTGKYPQFTRDCGMNRTPSCGWFGEETVKGASKR